MTARELDVDHADHRQFKVHADRTTEKQGSPAAKDTSTRTGGHWWRSLMMTRRTLKLLLRSNSRSKHMSFSADHEVDQSSSGSVNSVLGDAWQSSDKMYGLALCTNKGIHNIYILCAHHKVKITDTHRKLRPDHHRQPYPCEDDDITGISWGYEPWNVFMSQRVATAEAETTWQIQVHNWNHA
jgi:hypothetical protein